MSEVLTRKAAERLADFLCGRRMTIGGAEGGRVVATRVTDNAVEIDVEWEHPQDGLANPLTCRLPHVISDDA